MVWTNLSQLLDATVDDVGASLQKVQCVQVEEASVFSAAKSVCKSKDEGKWRA